MRYFSLEYTVETCDRNYNEEKDNIISGLHDGSQNELLHDKNSVF